MVEKEPEKNVYHEETDALQDVLAARMNLAECRTIWAEKRRAVQRFVNESSLPG